MKKRLLGVLLFVVLVSVCVGCGAESTTNGQTEVVETPAAEESTPEQTAEPIETPEEIEEPHTHNYAEEITTDATCEADGLKTFTCECGDTYTEAIPAVGHVYENYVSNNDATYLADGTETSKCNTCDLTDTRTAEGSKLEYTYTEMNATMYATQTVNVRNLPSTDGEKIGSLSTNQEITVLGQCNETSWYKFELDEQTAFVSNSYLSTEKVEVAPPAPQPPQYVNGWNDMGDWFVYIHSSLTCPENNVNGAFWEDKEAILRERYPGCNTTSGSGIKLTDGTSSAWFVSVGGTHSYDYPQALLDFIKVNQYRY